MHQRVQIGANCGRKMLDCVIYIR